MRSVICSAALAAILTAAGSLRAAAPEITWEATSTRARTDDAKELDGSIEPSLRSTAAQEAPPPQPRNALTVEAVLGIALAKGREARLAEQELARARETYLGVRAAGYHASGTATADSLDNRAVSVSRNLSQGTRVTAAYNNPQIGPEARTLSVDHAIFLGNGLDLWVAHLSYESARQAYRVRIEQYKSNVIAAFFNLVLARERLETLNAGVHRAKDLVDFARARFDLGATTKVDVLNSQVDLANAQSQVLAQSQQVDKSRDDLVDLIGLPLDAPLEIADPLRVEDPPKVQAAWYRSDVERERIQVEVARTRVTDARYKTYPDIHVHSSVTDNTPLGTPEVVASVQYNFPLGTAAADHTYRGLKHDYASAQYVYTNTRQQVAREQRDIVRTLKTDRDSVRIAAQTVASATESYEASQISFQRGIISNIDLRTSQANLTAAKGNYVSLLIAYRVAFFQYIHLMGGDL